MAGLIRYKMEGPLGSLMSLAVEVPAGWSTITFSGIVALDARKEGLRAQAKEVFRLLNHRLHAIGLDASNVVSVDVDLLDPVEGFKTMNDVWSTWVEHDHLPARTTRGSQLALDGLLIELSVVAARPPK